MTPRLLLLLVPPVRQIPEDKQAWRGEMSLLVEVMAENVDCRKGPGAEAEFRCGSETGGWVAGQPCGRQPKLRGEVWARKLEHG